MKNSRLQAHRGTALVAVIAVLALSGCDSPSPSELAQPHRPSMLIDRATQPRNAREALRRVGQELNGFGGAWIDTGTNMLVINRARRVLAREGFVREARARLADHGFAAVLRGVADAREQPVDFTYGELHGAFERLRAYMERMPIVGTMSIGIRDDLNRVAVTAAPAVLPELRQAARRLGVEQLTSFGEEGNVEFAQTSSSLRSRWNFQYPAGIQIQYLRGSATPDCTIGWNAWFDEPPFFPTDSTVYFITASHCSLNLGVNDGTSYYQPVVGNIWVFRLLSGPIASRVDSRPGALADGRPRAVPDDLGADGPVDGRARRAA